MNIDLDKKLKRIHEALGRLESDEIKYKRVTSQESSGLFYVGVDFGSNKTPEELENTAYLIIANIASIKDHFKAWCRSNSNDFNVESVIDANLEVALVHDLWNIEKHAELNRPPRSGKHPKITNLHESLKLSTGTKTESSVKMFMDVSTGKMVQRTTGSGSVSMAINGDIVDENGNSLGGLACICGKATDIWVSYMQQAGIKINV